MPWFILAFLLVPLLEIMLFVYIGSKIGVLWVVALIVLTSMGGAALAVREGKRVLHKVRYGVWSGPIPGQEVIEGICILLGGILLIIPGFITDTIGLLLLFPATRRIGGSLLVRSGAFLFLRNRIIFKKWRR